MSFFESIEAGVTAPQGFWAGATSCGIKATLGARDLALLYSDAPCAAAGTFTTNKVRAASVQLTQRRLAEGQPVRAVVINSGVANACTGPEGLADALEMARLAAAKVGVATEQVLVASTGVIGVRLPLHKIARGLQEIVLRPDGGHDLARGMMTTDTRPKEVALRLSLEGREVALGGVAKGAGMIHPNMATMLAFIATDAAIERPFLEAALRRSVDLSFNMISVDGDTSPSDTVLLLANGRAGNSPLRADSPEAPTFQAALDQACAFLAQAIVRDGEGATKFIEVRVSGAQNEAQARLAARAVARSNLVKAAVYGSDPNWGRILGAIGYSGADVDPDIADIAIGEIELMRGGKILPFDRAAASAALQGPEVLIKAHLHLGPGEATAWGCDLTEKYVEINAKYTT